MFNISIFQFLCFALAASAIIAGISAFSSKGIQVSSERRLEGAAAQLVGIGTFSLGLLLLCVGIFVLPKLGL